MSEHRRRLGDACVSAVPAEHAGASSSSGDHHQQYYLHCPNLATFEEKDLFLIFFNAKNKMTVTHLPEILSPDWTPQGRALTTPPRGGACVPVATRF